MAVQRATQDYFTLFGLPQRFLVDEVALKEAYFMLQREWHPDRMVGVSAGERAAAMQQATWVNDAYETLRSPRKRAEYLLQLREFSKDRKSHTEHDPTLMAEVMEQRELLSETEEVEVIGDLIMNNSQCVEDCLAVINQAFEAENYIAVQKHVTRLIYLEKFGEEAQRKAYMLRRNVGDIKEASL